MFVFFGAADTDQEIELNTSHKMLLATLLTTVTAASQAQNFCVFDPSGTSGDSFSMMKDYSLSATQWGANLTLKAYTDEELVAKDFKSGKCDGYGNHSNSCPSI